MQIKDELARVPGVGDVFLFGQRDYSMRIWVDPAKLAGARLTAADVVAAIREQNAPGGHRLDRPAADRRTGSTPDHARARSAGSPTSSSSRTSSSSATPDGRMVRLKDVGRVELGAKNEDVSVRLDGQRHRLPGDLPDARRQRPRRRATASWPRWTSSKQTFPRASTTRSASTPRPTPASRSTRCQDAARRDHPRGHRRAAVPAELAVGDHSAGRRAGGHHRHVRRHGCRSASASTT